MNKDEILSFADNQEKEHLWIEALANYKVLYNDDDGNAFLIEKMAWCASRAAIYDEAIKYFMKLTNIQPKIAKWYYCVGYQYYMQKEWSNANEWFNKALAIYPEYFIVRYRLGYSLRQLCGTSLVLKKSEFWEALKQYSECDKIWENYNDEQKQQNAGTYADICYQKGKLLTERNRMEEAIKSFERSLLLNGELDECKYQLSKAYLELGNTEMAEKVLPSTVNKYYVTELKIDIYLANGRTDEALELLEKHIQKRKKDYLYRKISDVYLSKNDLKKAIQYADQAEKLNPNNHYNCLLIAKILLKAGLYNSAYKQICESIQLKKKYFSSNFDEAEELKKQIEIQMKDQNYIDDDRNALDLLRGESYVKEKIIGEIMQFNRDRGFGFISSQGKKYFFHISDFNTRDQSLITEGSDVIFEEKNTSKGLSVVNVDLLSK